MLCHNPINSRHTSSEEKRRLDSEYKQIFESKEPDFQKFYSIVHELRTYDYLIKKGFDVIAQDDDHIGPDFQSENIGYIECVSVTKGKPGTDGRRYVDDRLSRETNRYQAALPRISSVIKDKKEKFKEYLEKKAIDSEKPRIIAVNTSVFADLVRSELLMELFLEILYGEGPRMMKLRRKPTNNLIEDGYEYHQYKNKEEKHNGSNIELDYFAQDEFKIISAIIATNNPLGEKVDNKYFGVLLNPLANNPIDIRQLNNVRYLSRSAIMADYFDYKWHN